MHEEVGRLQPRELLHAVTDNTICYLCVRAGDEVTGVFIGVDRRQTAGAVLHQRGREKAGAKPLVGSRLDDVRRPERTDKRVPAESPTETNLSVSETAPRRGE